MAVMLETYGMDRRNMISDQFRKVDQEGGGAPRQTLADRRIEAPVDPLADRRKDTVQISGAALNKFKESENNKMEISAILNGTDEDGTAKASGLMRTEATDASALKKMQQGGADAPAEGAAGAGMMPGMPDNNEELQKQLKEAQERLAEAQEKLAQAQREAAQVEDASQSQAANAKVQAAQQEVSAIQAEISTLSSQMSQG